MSDVSVRVLSWRNWPAFASEWESLAESCSSASFFLSREWVDAWMSTFASELNPELLVFEAGGQVVGSCLLVWRRQWVKGVPMRRVYLNCAGENEADTTFIEYNGLLARPHREQEVADALVTVLKDRPWDELLLAGVYDQPAIRAIADPLGTEEAAEKPSPYVDLKRLRRDSVEFDSVLSPNTRQQVRRAQRLYEQASGPCSVNIAGTIEEALAMFAEMAGMHQIAWRNRGQPGVFNSPAFVSFHERLIRAAFPGGRVQLLRVQAGSETVGVLYSFIYRGRLYFYQSGFHYRADNRMKPGLLTHHLAIRHCLQQTALEEYDFLSGDSQYKRSLATDSRVLRWSLVRRRTLPVLVFFGLRSLKRACAGILGKSRHSG